MIGLHDSAVEGTRGHGGKVNALRQSAMDHTSPPVRARFDQVPCVNSRGGMDALLVARVEPGECVVPTSVEARN